MTKQRIVSLLKWGALLPLAVALVFVNALRWATDASWVQTAAGYTLPTVILGFAVLLIVQSFQQQLKESAH